jgi:DNA repair protein RadD
MNDLFHPKKPWPHQKDAVALTIDAILNREHTCVTAPTGAGKTICITAVIRWCAETNRKLVLYTNRILLTEQTSKVLDDHSISYGIIAASMPKRRATLRDIQLASVQTVHRRCLVGGQSLFPADVVLVDEFHQCCNGATLQLLERHKAQGAVVIGLTATPIGVSHVAPKLAIAGTVSQCRHVGALVPAIYKAPSELDFSKLEVTDSGEFNYKEVKKLYNPAIFGHVYDSWCEHNPDARATLGFAPGVQESKWFVDQFEARGVRAAHIDGEDVYVDHCNYKSSREVRDQVIARWRSGEIKVIWNRFVLREGIDFPWMYCLILACPIGSLHGYIQTTGRVLRYSPETPDVVQILDHCGNYWRHGYSPNDDIDWEQFYYEDVAFPTRKRKAELGENPEKEPLRCPMCGNVIGKGNQCPPPPFGCGYRITRRSRMVIQTNGKLKDVSHPAVPKRIVKQRNDTIDKWVQCFFRCKSAGMSISQARGLFVYENHYWPPENLPYMPKERLDWCRVRKIEKIKPEELISRKEYEAARSKT